MKKILLAVLVLLGLQTQAQISPCDSMTVTGSQYQLTMEVNNINTIIDYWVTTAPDMTILGEDSMTNTHTVLNSNPMSFVPYDTLITCISSSSAQITCCVTWVWNGTMWMKMGPQQPYFCCDSITYWTDHSQGFNIGLDTTNIIHTPDSMEVMWAICNSSQCYSGQGMYDYFPQIMTTDTIKVCYDVMLWESGVLEVCTNCDSLIFDQGINNWVVFSNQGNPVSINEFIIERFNDGKMYDLLGREVTTPQIGQLYIRNNKKYIRIK